MANRSKYRSLKAFKPTKEEKRALASALFSHKSKFIYKRLKNGKYRTYCFRCNNYKTVTLDELKQIRASRLCPTCLNTVETGIKQEMTESNYIAFPKGEVEEYGLFVAGKWKFGSAPKLTTCETVLYSDDPEHCKAWRNGVVAGLGYRLYRIAKMQEFKDCRFDTYFGRTGYYNRLEVNNIEYKSRKQYYQDMLETMEIEPSLIKSNQKKLIQESLLNKNQVSFILIFNLKSREELFKYQKYINYSTNVRWLDVKGYINRLNIYHLDYLSRNNIALHNYLDYVDQCEMLGLKLDKPKEFYVKHRELAELIKINRNSIYSDLIKKNYDNYIQYEYIAGKVHILPFETPEEIIKCGSELHNCIAQYIQNYAKKRTILFKMLVANKLEVAIEVRGGVLLQAYQDMNKDVNKYQMKHINKWLKKEGLIDGR